MPISVRGFLLISWAATKQDGRFRPVSGIICRTILFYWDGQGNAMPDARVANPRRSIGNWLRELLGD